MTKSNMVYFTGWTATLEEKPTVVKHTPVPGPSACQQPRGHSSTAGDPGFTLRERRVPEPLSRSLSPGALPASDLLDSGPGCKD